MVEGSIPKKTVCIYLDPNIRDAFKKICVCEGVPMSHKIEQYMARYVAVHTEGNPQLHLDPFIKQTTKTCFRCEGKFPSLIKVKFISGLIAHVCSECLASYRQQTTIKKVLGVTE